MSVDIEDRIGVTEPACVSRIGMARLAKMAFDGQDLRPLYQTLIGKLLDGTADAGEGLDLALIAQLLGEKQAGLSIQRDILNAHQLFRLPCATDRPRLRVLALAAATDMGSNTPIEFLLEDLAFELMVLYVVPEAGLPASLPDHDVAIVIASDSEDCRDVLSIIDRAAARWPRPLLNPPDLVGNLDRDKLHRLIGGIDGVVIPPTLPFSRTELSLASPAIEAGGLMGVAFPLIVRPRGSHAGVGLARIENAAALVRYLDARAEDDFFVAPFIDYSSEDGLFRKYRVVFVDGTPYACHMAVADRWDIWYLNAGMAGSASKRLEEETFMRTFDIGFGRRHHTALAGIAALLRLDYFTIDCAEMRDGSLLIFEADNTAVVHNMDSPDVFPYKAPQMCRIFAAFAAMLQRHGRSGQEQAA